MSAAKEHRSGGLNLEQQKKRAKELVRAHAAEKAEAAERVVRHLPQAQGLSTVLALSRRLSLSEAQLVVAREAGFASWARMKHTLEVARLGLDERLEAVLDGVLAGDAPLVGAALAAEPKLAESALHLAAALGDPERVLDALEREPGRAKERGGVRQWSPLFYVCAARLGRGDARVEAARVRIARRLLELGANPNEEIESFGSPGGFRSVLQAAAGDAASAELVHILIQANAALEPTGGSAGPVLPVTDAVRGGNIDCLRRLVEAKPAPWQLREALEAAIEVDRTDMCRLLLDHGADVNGAGRWWGQWGNGLHTAILLGRGRELLEVLLSSGVNIEGTDRDRRTAHALARRTGHEVAAELLRARGANDAHPDAVDRLIAACVAGDAAEARALRAAEPGLSADYRGTDHQVLCWAIRQRRFEAVPLLLEAGLDPNRADDHGETPLHLAVASDHASTIAALEAAGASRKAKNFQGQSPFEPIVAEAELSERHAAFEQAAKALAAGDLDTLRELIDQEPELVHEHSPRSHRATLLHYVASNGVEYCHTPRNIAQIAELLLERGAAVDALAHTYGGGPGQTALGLTVTSIGPEQSGVMADLVNVLLRGGAAIDGLDGECGPLLGAIGEGRKAAVEALLEAGARAPNLWAAAAAGRLDLVENFARGAAMGELGAAFLAACRFDRVDVAAALLARGVPIDVTDHQKFTGLHWAAYRANLAVLELLLARGAPLELRNVYGGTVLGTAIFAAQHAKLGEDHVGAVKRLCAAGASTNGWSRWWTSLPQIEAVLQRHGWSPSGP